MKNNDELAVVAALLATFAIVNHLWFLPTQYKPAATKLRRFRLQQGNALLYITPLSLTETMESLLKRAQENRSHDVFRRFTKEEITAYKAGKKLLYVRLLKNSYEFEKRIFTPFSVNDVYEMTDDDPPCLEFYMKDKVTFMPELVADADRKTLERGIRSQ
jgi:hypothetical protein